MWNYDKILEFPVNIKRPNAKAAQIIISQYGGPDGELGASLRYLSQKFAMPNRRVAGLLNDIGTEELAHLEMIGPSGSGQRFPAQKKQNHPTLPFRSMLYTPLLLVLSA